MNSVSFEDSVFIINMRIKMIRDILRLNPPHEFFLEKCIDDLVFIDWVLSCLCDQCSGINELDYASDTEWQFSQLLNEISNNSSPYSQLYFPETQTWIDKLRKESSKRKKQIDDSYVPSEQSVSEPVVSHAELNGLLGSP